MKVKLKPKVKFLDQVKVKEEVKVQVKVKVKVKGKAGLTRRCPPPRGGRRGGRLLISRCK